MNGRERFNAIMNYSPVDRLPVLYFGTWDETRERWAREGLKPGVTIEEQTGMDPDWEKGMWNAHDIVDIRPWPGEKDVVIEEGADYRIIRTSLGARIKEGTSGSSIPQHLDEALKPTRESWESFKKGLDPQDPRRFPADWQARAAAVGKRNYATTFLAGSLYGWPREWMGVEEWSCLPFTDPALYEEIIDWIATYFMTLYEPVLKKASFEFAYFFEDCCFKNGPLISPDLFKKFYSRYYRKMVDFYHRNGVDKIMLDSDGKVDLLIPLWLDAGIDILFPIEVGTWGADPVALRRQYGKRLRMFGGVNKLVIPKGEAAVREHLRPLRKLAEEGGYIPIPDHRIPPDCSLEAFRTYVKVFKEEFKPPSSASSPERE
jgi:hypothetical protein